MSFFRRKKFDNLKEYSSEEVERRQQNIPVFKDVPGFRFDDSLSPVDFDEEVLTFSKGNKKPIPASIEYLFERRISEKNSKNECEDDLVADQRKKEIPDLDRLLFEQSLIHPDVPKKKDEDNPKDKDFSSARDEEIIDFSKVPLADCKSIRELEKKHMNFYSILSKIQDTHVASDFKSAYDIQDRISYLLNHRTLLYKSLVKELLVYVDSIIEKLESYYLNISEKQKKFNKYNRKVSELKQYKFKTDESIKIIEKNQELALREMEAQKKSAEETS